MYERMLDKASRPTNVQIEEHLGATSVARLRQLESYLQSNYDLVREMRFPYGNSYGWGYKYSHKSVHLCDVFFEVGAFTVMMQVGKAQAVEEIFGELSSKAQELWAERYPCGKSGGGWIHYQVLDESELSDIYKFIYAKKKPTGGNSIRRN